MVTLSRVGIVGMSGQIDLVSSVSRLAKMPRSRLSFGIPGSALRYVEPRHDGPAKFLELAFGEGVRRSGFPSTSHTNFDHVAGHGRVLGPDAGGIWRVSGGGLGGRRSSSFLAWGELQDPPDCSTAPHPFWSVCRPCPPVFRAGRVAGGCRGFDACRAMPDRCRRWALSARTTSCTRRREKPDRVTRSRPTDRRCAPPR